MIHKQENVSYLLTSFLNAHLLCRLGTLNARRRGKNIMSGDWATISAKRSNTRQERRNRRRWWRARRVRRLHAPRDLLVLPVMGLLEPLVAGISHGRFNPGSARHSVIDPIWQVDHHASACSAGTQRCNRSAPGLQP